MKRSRALILALVVGVVGAVIGCPMSQPPILGAPDGRLLPCPTSPNCVCSQDPDPDRQIVPFSFTGNGAEALNSLRGAIQAEPRSKVVETKPDYLRAEFRSLVFRFVDDVEFLVDPGAQVIHVRSASRVGYSDLGVNRKRVERLRAAFAKAC